MGAFSLIRSGVEGLEEGCMWSPGQDHIIFLQVCEENRPSA